MNFLFLSKIHIYFAGLFLQFRVYRMILKISGSHIPLSLTTIAGKYLHVDELRFSESIQRTSLNFFFSLRRISSTSGFSLQYHITLRNSNAAPSYAYSQCFCLADCRSRYIYDKLNNKILYSTNILTMYHKKFEIFRSISEFFYNATVIINNKIIIINNWSTTIKRRIIDNDIRVLNNCFINNTIHQTFKINLGLYECNLQEIISICKQIHLVCMRLRWLTSWPFAWCDRVPRIYSHLVIKYDGLWISNFRRLYDVPETFPPLGCLFPTRETNRGAA